MEGLIGHREVGRWRSAQVGGGAFVVAADAGAVEDGLDVAAEVDRAWSRAVWRTAAVGLGVPGGHHPGGGRDPVGGAQGVCAIAGEGAVASGAAEREDRARDGECELLAGLKVEPAVHRVDRHPVGVGSLNAKGDLGGDLNLEGAVGLERDLGDDGGGGVDAEAPGGGEGVGCVHSSDVGAVRWLLGEHADPGDALVGRKVVVVTEASGADGGEVGEEGLQQWVVVALDDGGRVRGHTQDAVDPLGLLPVRSPGKLLRRVLLLLQADHDRPGVGL